MSEQSFETLTFDDVLQIHHLLVAEFQATPDAIHPLGMRDEGYPLQTAIFRQYDTMGSQLKYPTPLSNAAALCHGLCCDGGFESGNRRTGLLALLCHLDRNGLTLNDTLGQEQVCGFVEKIVARKFAPRGAKGDTSEAEIHGMTHWLQQHTRKIREGERNITFAELRGAFDQLGMELENPDGGHVDVVKYEMKRRGLFGKQERVRRLIARVPWMPDDQAVGRKALKSIREQCGLTKEKGFDEEMFHKARTPIPTFIARHRKALRRLAKPA